MRLKQIINRQKIQDKINTNTGAQVVLELPGEPLIYTIKYPVGQRHRGKEVFRNMQWRSIFKCYFRAHNKTTSPVVLLLRLYLTPPSSVNISAKALKSEKTPAVKCYEVCDYVLSFMEMLHGVLLNSYRQIVKLDVEKYYSSNPRTVFKFMSWYDYGKLQINDPVYSKTQSFRKAREKGSLQPERKRNEPSEAVCEEALAGCSGSTNDGSSSCCMPFPASSAKSANTKKKSKASLTTSLQKT